MHWYDVLDCDKNEGGVAFDDYEDDDTTMRMNVYQS